MDANARRHALLQWLEHYLYDSCKGTLDPTAKVLKLIMLRRFGDAGDCLQEMNCRQLALIVCSGFQNTTGLVLENSPHVDCQVILRALGGDFGSFLSYLNNWMELLCFCVNQNQRIADGVAEFERQNRFEGGQTFVDLIKYYCGTELRQSVKIDKLRASLLGAGDYFLNYLRGVVSLHFFDPSAQVQLLY